MSDTWLNYQYMIEFSYNGLGTSGQCIVSSVTSAAVKHGSASYLVSPVNGSQEKHYVYGMTSTEPLQVSIYLGDGAKPWLQWFADIQSGKKAETRNITLKLYGYGQSSSDEAYAGRLWLKWDLINCFPTQWQLKPMSISDGPSPMELDMTLQFESMVISDGDTELSEAMG